MSEPASGNVKVVCRFRPFNQKERALGVQPFYEVSSEKSVSVKETRNEKVQTLNFNFDRVFDQNSKQVDVYDYTARSVVDSVLEGFNGTVFAYGQTSSGKTFTMEGLSNEGEQSGVIPRMVGHVFNHIAEGPSSIEYLMKVSIVELYNQKLRDLLDGTRSDLKIRSDKLRGIYLENVTETYISEPSEVFEFLKMAQLSRAICATNMNERSSRSHMIFILTIHQTSNQDLSSKTGKLYLVDLAGSEKVSKTGAEGKVFEEAKKINMSLTTLGKVINALTDGKSTHIPYRDSKLTRVLQESLGGNSKTALIVTCSPHSSNFSETISTLRFGVSAKNIKNKPKINREITVPELQQLLEKAEARASASQRKVEELENYIRNQLKAKLPSNETKEDIVDDADEEQDERNERVKILEGEIELERSNGFMQAEKLDSLQRNYGLVCEKLQLLQKDNHALGEKNKKLEQQMPKESPEPVNVRNDLFQQILSLNSNPQINDLIEKCTAVPSDAESQVLRQLQQNLQQQKEKRKKAQETIVKNQKDIKKKLTSLENNIRQLTSVYHDLYVQQSKWKIQNNINLRHLQKKSQKIVTLENTVSDLREELSRKKARNSSEEESSFEEEEMIKQRQINSLKRFAHSKLVKPLRGGNKVLKQ